MANNNVRTVTTKGAVKVQPAGDVQDLEDEDLGEHYKHAYIPDAFYATKYVRRTIKGVEDFTMLDVAMRDHLNVLLRGGTGSGKTMLGLAYAAHHQIPYYSVPCDVSIDGTSLFGKYMPTDVAGKYLWGDGPVTTLTKFGGVLNISEINFMPPKIAASLFQLTDHRRSLTLLGHRGETIKAHPNLLIIADMNPNYRGTQPLNAAFANRFHIKVDWEYDPKIESKLIRVPSLLQTVRSIRDNTTVTTPIGTNSMQDFERMCLSLGYNFALENFLAQFSPTERDGVGKAFQALDSNMRSEVASLVAGSTPEADMKEMASDDSWFDQPGDASDYTIQPINTQS